jgi:hypothetical protein
MHSSVWLTGPDLALADSLFVSLYGLESTGLVRASDTRPALRKSEQQRGRGCSAQLFLPWWPPIATPCSRESRAPARCAGGGGATERRARRHGAAVRGRDSGCAESRGALMRSPTDVPKPAGGKLTEHSIHAACPAIWGDGAVRGVEHGAALAAWMGSVSRETPTYLVPRTGASSQQSSRHIAAKNPHYARSGCWIESAGRRAGRRAAERRSG